MDFTNVAKNIFNGIKLEANDEDIKRLADNMALLERSGLSKLNDRLINSGRNIFDTIAEHNFAVILFSQHGPAMKICYEPGIGRPPDFKVELGNCNYWIQIKNLAKLERENRQAKLFWKIKEAAREIKVGKFFGCILSDDFKEDCVHDLDFIKTRALSTAEGEKISFTGMNNQKAEIEFWSPRRTALSELTLGVSGDLGIVEITGQDKEQIKLSLLKAVGAFSWKTDRNNINLIVMEADNKEDIDICDALFGTEYEIDRPTDGGYIHSWSRDKDGLFSERDFSEKVAGVIAIKRKRERVKEIPPLPPEVEEFTKVFGMTDEGVKEALEWKSPGLIADYNRILYINNIFDYLVEDIKKLLPFDKIVNYKMRPDMGYGNFKLP